MRKHSLAWLNFFINFCLSGRSKGYGFVEMEDEAEQQKVLDEMKTITVDGREVSIKVSVSVPHSEELSTEDAPAEATTDAE